MALTDELNDLLVRYAKATMADYHRLLENAPEKGERASALFSDFLRSQGLNAHADLIDRAASETGYGVNRLPVGRFEAEEYEPGQIRARIGSWRDRQHYVNLSQRSAANPSTMLHWSVIGHPDELKPLVEGLVAEGTTPEVIDDNDHHRKRLEAHYGLTPPDDRPGAEPEADAGDADDADWWKNGPKEEYSRSLSEALVRYSMASHEDFHNAIHADVAADMPHLAYADWLQENGDEEEAETIRKAVASGQRWLDSGTGINVPPPGMFTYGGLQAGTDGEGRPTLMKTLYVGSASPTPQHKVIGYSSPALYVPEGAEKHSASESPVKYAAVPDHDVADDYKPTGIAPRIGNALNRLAAEDGTHAALAEGILRVGDHSLLPILADRLDEIDHPLKDAFDWRHAPRAMAIDRALAAEIARHRIIGYRGVEPLHATRVVADWRGLTGRPKLSKKKALDAVRKAVPDATKDDLFHSVIRLDDNQYAATSPKLVQTVPDEHAVASMNAYLQQLGAAGQDPHKYPDTRPPNKRYAADEVPVPYRKSKEWIRSKIRKLRKEGRPEDQSVAIAMRMAGAPKPTKYSMAEEKDFHQAMHENPADRTHPLVYADWLQENGQEPQADFIRRAVSQAADKGWEGVMDRERWKEDHPESVAAVPHKAHINIWYTRHSQHDPERLLSWIVRAKDYEEARQHLQSLHSAGVPVVGPAARRILALDTDDAAKYASYKAPVGGMVVKDSPLAVVGRWANGGEFAGDLQKISDKVTSVPVPQTPKPRPSLKALVARLKARR